MSSMFQLQPTLRRVATSQDQQTHAVVGYAQREARRHWFRKPNALFPADRETLLYSWVPRFCERYLPVGPGDEFVNATLGFH